MFCFYVGTFLVSANKAGYKLYIDDDEDTKKYLALSSGPKNGA